MSYDRLIEKIVERQHLARYRRISMEWELESFPHPDFDIPGVLVNTPTGRVMFVVEGEKELVGPIIEKAREILDKQAA